MSKIPTWAIRTKADREAIKQGCYWDAEKAAVIVSFAETTYRCQRVRGKLKLLRWQRRFLMSLYGFRLPNGNRRFRYATLHIAKKNGKTLLVSIISAFELLMSGEPSPYVASAAAAQKNATQVFDEARWAVDHSEFKPWCKITRNQKTITVPDLNSKYVAVASDGDTLHGEPMSCVILDECHAHKSGKLANALVHNIKARPNGFVVYISTAGDDTSHWYYHRYGKAKCILSGEDLYIRSYAEVYESDPDADPEDPQQWHKANPSLGTSFTEDDFRLDLLSAKGQVETWLNCQRLCLN